MISITPKGNNFSCPALSNGVADIILGAVDQVSSCHRQSHTILDRVWRDGYTGVIHAEIVRTLPPPFMGFNPLVDAMREQSFVRSFDRRRNCILSDDECERIEHNLRDRLQGQLPWDDFDLRVASCGAVNEAELDAKRFVDEIQVEALTTAATRRSCCGSAQVSVYVIV